MAAKLAGGGKGKYELGQNSDINVTPFVDVMLVLLIIFMVAAPLATTAIKIDLPPATNEHPKDQKKPTFLSIRKGGDVYVIPDASLGGVQKVPDLSQLIPILAPLLTGEGPVQERTVLIRADRDVRYKEFMNVVNQLQREGYYKVGLIAEELG
jgi:biopolymer transport protein ExbD